MCTALVLLLASALPSADNRIDADRFSRLLRGLHDEIRDVSLVCEGTEELLQPGLVDPDRTTRVQRFQATYDYRSDNATRLDVYTHGDQSDSIFLRQTMALIGKKLETYSAVPDQKRVAAVESAVGNPTHINVLGSPHAIIYMWYFKYHGDNFVSMRFEHVGWEEVNGHRCARVRLDFLPNMPDSVRSYREYWIDLERGGHPLKIENYRQGRLATRTHEIRLARFPLESGGHAWLPVDGVHDSLIWGTAKGIVRSEKPISRASYHVVKSSVRLNQGLSDKFFALRNNGAPPSSRRPLELSRLFDKEAEQPPAFRTDPASVQKELDAKLADAEKQATTLSASSRARTTWDVAFVAQILLSTFGVLVLLAAYPVWRRSRAS